MRGSGLKFQSDDILDTPHGNFSIWRYMPHSRFEQLLEEKRLFFGNAERMTDQFEVSVPESTISAKRSELEEQGLSGKDLEWNLGAYIWENSPQKKDVFISCWSIRPHESWGLWKIYLKGEDRGVALRTSVSGLRRALRYGGGSEASRFYISRVRYEKHIQPADLNRLSIITTKKPFYDYENELRAFFLKDDLHSNAVRMDRLKEGFGAAIDLEKLVQYVYVSPFARTGYWREIEKLMKSHGFGEFRVRISEIREA